MEDVLKRLSEVKDAEGLDNVLVTINTAFSDNHIIDIEIIQALRVFEGDDKKDLLSNAKIRRRLRRTLELVEGNGKKEKEKENSKKQKQKEKENSKKKENEKIETWATAPITILSVPEALEMLKNGRERYEIETALNGLQFPLKEDEEESKIVLKSHLERLLGDHSDGPQLNKVLKRRIQRMMFVVSLLSPFSFIYFLIYVYISLSLSFFK